MSRICLLCTENETPDGHNKICDPCFDNAGNYLEDNVHLLRAIPDLLSQLRSLLEDLKGAKDLMLSGNESDSWMVTTEGWDSLIRATQEAMAKAERR